MAEPTPMGAEASVEDRIASFLEAEDAPEQEPQEAQQETVAEEPVSAQAEEVEETEEPEAEAKAEAEEVDDESEDDDVTLDAQQFAEMLGLDSDSVIVTDTGGIKFRTKVDGEQGEATLAELIKNHQIDLHVRRKSEAVAEERRELDRIKAEQTQQLQNTLQQSAALLQAQEAEMMKQFQSIDWDTLRLTDPGEFAAQQQQFQVAKQQLDQRKEQARQMIEYTAQQQAQQSNAHYQQYLADQLQALQTKHPEYNDSESFGKLKSDVVKYLENDVFSEPPQNQFEQNFLSSLVSDHRGITLLRKAMLYDQAQGNVDAVKKKVTKLPKIVKPGASKSKAQKERAAYQDELSKFKKNARTKRGQDSTQDMAALIEKHFL